MSETTELARLGQIFARALRVWEEDRDIRNQMLDELRRIRTALESKGPGKMELKWGKPTEQVR